MRALKKSARYHDGLASVVTTAVRVAHLDPARAAEVIKPLLSQQAVARPVADGSDPLLLAASCSL